MRVIETGLPGVLIIEPRVHGDDRGFFFESYNHRDFAKAGIPATFVQDNQSRSSRHVLRGLHYQIEQAQGKLVRVLAGEIFDVAVDLRRGSATFGKSTGFVLSAANRHTAWIPAGFAHGFLVLSEYADCLYKATDYWAPAHERTLRWDDPALGIAWPLTAAPVLSAKDRAGVTLDLAEVYP